MSIGRCHQILDTLAQKSDYKSWDQICPDSINDVTALFAKFIPSFEIMSSFRWNLLFRKAHVTLYKKQDVLLHPLIEEINSWIRTLDLELGVEDRCVLILRTLQDSPESHSENEKHLETYSEIEELFCRSNISTSTNLHLRALFRHYFFQSPHNTQLLNLLANIIKRRNAPLNSLERLELIFGSLEGPTDTLYWSRFENLKELRELLDAEIKDGDVDYKEAARVLEDGLAKFERYCFPVTEPEFQASVKTAQKTVAAGLALLQRCEEYLCPSELKVSASVIAKNRSYKKKDIRKMLISVEPVLCRTPMNRFLCNMKLRELHGQELCAKYGDDDLVKVVVRCIHALRGCMDTRQHFSLILASLELWPESHLYGENCLEDVNEIQAIFRRIFRCPSNEDSEFVIKYNTQLRRCYSRMIRRDKNKYALLIGAVKKFIIELNKHAGCLQRCEWIFDALNNIEPHESWESIMPESIDEAGGLFQRLALLVPEMKTNQVLWVARLEEISIILKTHGINSELLDKSIQSCLVKLDPSALLIEKCNAILTQAGQWADDKSWKQTVHLAIPETTALFRKLIPLTAYIQNDKDLWIARFKRLKWNLMLHQEERIQPLLLAIKECVQALKTCGS